MRSRQGSPAWFAVRQCFHIINEQGSLNGPVYRRKDEKGAAKTVGLPSKLQQARQECSARKATKALIGYVYHPALRTRVKSSRIYAVRPASSSANIVLLRFTELRIVFIRAHRLLILSACDSRSKKKQSVPW